MNTFTPPALIQPAWLMMTRLRRGRPRVLAARITGAFALAEITVHSAAGLAATAGTLTGILTWFALTARSDFAPPPGR